MSAQAKDTLSVFTHHLKAFDAVALGKAPIEELMSDYAEDSIIVSPEGACRGLAEIRTFFEEYLKEVTPAVLEAFKITCQQIHGEVVMMVWKDEPYIPFGADMFVIRGGKIREQTTVSYMP